ncbi:DUF1214 domain-containing protein [Variovorax sp. YR216]|uniref:DUF1214 domain-containing protein n=1 Tax=Variovorax sp. YR216 TaxID=1882828 RepID=UPI00089B3032|nr:DUF1214 domain-containing protein [Variovorax sp. YR216]SEB24712.1 Uncharacterized conserved protein [Variovorax sp. YR216]
MKCRWILSGLLATSVWATSAAAQSPPAGPSDQEVSDAYIYLLSRLLVLRQQQLDFKQGFKWNQLVHRKPGEVDWPNPNLDVAYSEAWVAIDEKSCLTVSVPKITGRYYTVHFLNGWGETVANINERVYPGHPFGNFAVCLKGAQVKLPAGTQRVDVPVRHMRVLSRVELGADWKQAIALQRQVRFGVIGKTALPPVPRTVMFDPEKLPGVEAFESAELALDSEPDLNPGMEKLQADTRAIAQAVKDPAQRQRIDQVIRTQAFADFHKALPNVGHGTRQNGWVLPSTSGAYMDDWLVRTLVNYGGIWANTPQEVIYYKGFVDSSGAPLSGDHVYKLHFTKAQLPAQYATHFWSVIGVDAAGKRVLPNALKRYLLNNQSGLKYGADGSLTLYFADKKPQDAPESNWLPTPKGTDYNLTFRFYRPQGAVADRTYFPPSLVKQ